MDELRLTILGIGGAFDADKGIANTGALIEILDRGQVSERVLIDCGHTCGRQLDQLGLSYDDIDAVLLTHAHGDHMDGLEIAGYRARFLCGRRTQVLSDPSVLSTAWASLRAKMGWLKTAPGESRIACMDDYFDSQPVCPAGKELAGGRLRVNFFPVDHIPRDPACGIRLELNPQTGVGPVIRWSGDTVFDPDGEVFRDLRPERGDMVFHECKWEPWYDTTVHTHLEELGGLSEETRARIVLVHHGQIDPGGDRVDGMVLGQPFQSYSFKLL